MKCNNGTNNNLKKIFCNLAFKNNKYKKGIIIILGLVFINCCDYKFTDSTEKIELANVNTSNDEVNEKNGNQSYDTTKEGTSYNSDSTPEANKEENKSTEKGENNEVKNELDNVKPSNDEGNEKNENQSYDITKEGMFSSSINDSLLETNKEERCSYCQSCLKKK